MALVKITAKQFDDLFHFKNDKGHSTKRIKERGKEVYYLVDPYEVEVITGKSLFPYATPNLISYLNH